MVQNPIVTKLRSKGTTKVTIQDDKLGPSTWEIRAISTWELIDKSEFFENLPDKVEVSKADPTKMDPATYKLVKQSVLPMMKAFLPLCTLDPKIITDFDDPALKDPNSNVVHLSDIPLKIASDLFNEILKISGLSKEGEEERKKLVAPTSAKA